LRKPFADGGYQGPQFCKAQKKALPHLATEIVKRSDRAKGLELLLRRWVVERTFAWELRACYRQALNHLEGAHCVSPAIAIIMHAMLRHGTEFKSA
jgi:transposase